MAFQQFENWNSFIYTPQNIIDGSREKWSLQHDGPHFEGKPSFQCPKFPSSGPISKSMLSGMSAPLLAVFRLLAPSLQLCERRRSTKKQNGQVPARSPCFLVKMQCQWIMRWGLWHKALWKFLCQTSEATEIILGGRHLWRDDTCFIHIFASQKSEL